MQFNRSGTRITAAACAVLLIAGTTGNAQAPQGRGGGRGAALANFLFVTADTDNDGNMTRVELKSALDKWYTEWDTNKTNALTQEQLFMGVNAAMPPPPPPAGGRGGGAPQAQNQTPNPEHVTAMMAALPDKAPAKPKQARKVLVLAKAGGFVHSSIPLAGRTIEEIGKKTGAWSTTISYDAADINDANLKQYDAIFLASTTGAFLDDPNDAAATAARRKALLDFVRGGKGLAGIHAATDSYHQSSAPPAGRGRGGRGGGFNMQVVPLVQLMLGADKNADMRVSREEFTGLADTWFDKFDEAKTGTIAKADFPARYASLTPPAAPQTARADGDNGQAAATELGPDTQVGTWPEFNKMIGGFFKFHWNDGQKITVKIDDPKNPINAAFKGQEYDIVDETYTMGRDTYSRENLRVLTSINYDKMSAKDKAKESNPRADGDYALSWIRREGKGRVFYEAHGHNEKIYAIKPMLEHITAGMQYALGDLQADDSPSVKPGAKKTASK
jgi:type 1 glutamine amidotransferase